MLTRRISCPKVDCVAHTDSFSERPLLEHPVDRSHVVLSCPFCRSLVFSCENCAALLEDSADAETTLGEVRVCRKCGFMNLVDDELRQTLNLPSRRPTSIETARVIQRQISEPNYIEYKQSELDAVTLKATNRGDGSLTAPKSWDQGRGVKRRRLTFDSDDSQVKRRKSDEPEVLLDHQNWRRYLKEGEKTTEIIETIKGQLRSLRDPAIRVADSKMAWHMMTRTQSSAAPNFLPSMNGDDTKPTRTNLEILKALYRADAASEGSLVLKTIQEAEAWLAEERTDLEAARLRLDVASHLSELPISELLPPSGSTPTLMESKSAPKIDASALVGGVLKFRRDQMKYRFQLRSEKYLQVLESINSELQVLYKDLALSVKESTKHSSSSSSPLVDALLGDDSQLGSENDNTELQSRERIQRTHSKICIWHSLYKAISALVT
eukprot:TRINITY_DN10006_c0_g1_i1.p1 TRINITY_DN10006_c0_g1~~TRINITY_DN10006_c0_g1_i1.p1  ORF type:complete len:437 (-),score=63.51 TRINITY_DN10006_c0_g1_i1:40-1350(-)